MELWKTTNGVGWHNNYNWGSDESYCYWFGIGCESPRTDVRVIDLSYNALNGSLPYSLNKLLYLRKLNLQGNSLYGSIPPLDNPILQHMDLSRNRKLTGSIPSLSPMLQNLTLSYCNITGMIPNLSYMSALKNIQLGYNSLTGTIPPIFSNLPSLMTLNLQHNMLTGTIPSVSYVLEINLSVNRLTGNYPNNFGASYTNISWNNLNGVLPDSLSYASYMVKLDLSHNQFSGSVPDFNFYYQQFTLDLSYNKFTSLPNMKSDILDYCSFDMNSFRCPIPQWSKYLCYASCN
jgi:hypothetical protein